MLMHVFQCPGRHRPLGIGAELVKPRVRCPACQGRICAAVENKVRLSRGWRPEMIGLVTARSKN